MDRSSWGPPLNSLYLPLPFLTSFETSNLVSLSPFLPLAIYLSFYWHTPGTPCVPAPDPLLRAPTALKALHELLPLQLYESTYSIGNTFLPSKPYTGLAVLNFPLLKYALLSLSHFLTDCFSSWILFSSLTNSSSNFIFLSLFFKSTFDYE